MESLNKASLDTWVRTVNKGGTEYGVTLVVSGLIVTGHLSPISRYHAWLDEVSSRARFGGGALPEGQLGPISQRQSAEAIAAWAAIEESADDDYTIDQVCLRDVTVLGAGSRAARLPFLLLDRRAISGFSPARLSV